MRGLDRLADSLRKRSDIILDEGKDLVHGVSLDDMLDVVAPFIVEPNMYGVGVTEEIMKIAHDFLIGLPHTHG